MDNGNIAELLKRYRKEAGYSVKEAVQKLSEQGLIISDKTMYSWESGHRQPDADTFLALCRLYDVKSFSDIEKAPDPDITESEAEIEKRAEILADALERCGYIPKGGDLSDDQLKFMMGLVDFLDRYFG